MFAQPLTAGGPSGLTRPVIVGLVLLLLFLSMQAEWTSSPRKPEVPRKRFLSTSETPSNQMNLLTVRDEVRNSQLNRIAWSCALITACIHQRRDGNGLGR